MLLNSSWTFCFLHIHHFGILPSANWLLLTSPVIVWLGSGTRIKTRKRNITIPLDPASFSDAVVQIYLDNAGDLVISVPSFMIEKIVFSVDMTNNFIMRWWFSCTGTYCQKYRVFRTWLLKIRGHLLRGSHFDGVIHSLSIRWCCLMWNTIEDLSLLFEFW